MKYSIGKVSEFFGVSTGTLRHYDKIGLLKPEVDPENGYRYYNLEHILQLGFILNSKYLQIPLSEVKDILEGEDLLKYIDLLSKQQVIIREKIKHLEELDKSISQSKSSLNRIVNFKANYDFDNIKILNDKRRYYYISEKDYTENKVVKNILNDTCIENYGKFENTNKVAACSIFSIHNDNQVVVNEKDHFLLESPKFKETLDNYFLNTYGNIPIKEIDGSYILVDFYGSEKELKDYLSLLHNHFKGDPNEILVESNFYLPKEKNPNCFCKILYQL